MKRLPSKREMRTAYLSGDASYDGIFYLAVRTTGVFCRPSCRARKPRPENVEYFASPRDALAAGYRPCKRCRPLHSDGRPPEWVAKLLEHVEANPRHPLRDEDLRALELDPARVRRYFKRHFGMTFHDFHRARRMGAALEHIADGGRLLDAACKSGYRSDSGFRAAFTRMFGTTPGRGRGADCVVCSPMPSPLGLLLIGASPTAVCLLEFADQDSLPAQVAVLPKRFARPVVPGSNSLLDTLARELSEYFTGRRRHFSVPIEYPGTPFQRRVWQELLRIPYGRTCSYAELAERIGRPGAQRAVGRANGQNRIAIVIPCHRVVNKSGKLGGYGGGLWRKQFLLNLERAQPSRDEPPRDR